MPDIRLSRCKSFLLATVKKNVIIPSFALVASQSLIYFRQFAEFTLGLLCFLQLDIPYRVTIDLYFAQSSSV